MVDGNTQFLRFFVFETGFFQFLEGEASAFADFNVVSQAWAADDWTEEGSWSGCKSGCALDSGCATTLFARGLVEPCPDSALPVLK